MKRKFTLITLVLIIALVGCKKQDEEIFLNSNNCQLPCWNNILMGETTKADFELLLDNLDFINQKTRIKNGESWILFDNRSFFKYQQVEIHGVGYFIGGRIEGLDIDGKLNSTFSQLLDQLGEPDYIINVPLSGGVPGSPSISYSVTAIYTSLGIAFTYDTRHLSKNMREEVQPDVPISSILIFDPKIFEEMVDAKLFGQSLITGEETRKHFIPWNGYGSLLEKYPPAEVN